MKKKKKKEVILSLSKAGYFASSHEQTFYTEVFLLHLIVYIVVTTKTSMVTSWTLCGWHFLQTFKIIHVKYIHKLCNNWKDPEINKTGMCLIP